MKLEHKMVGKSWGWERWIVNNELYCGKELFIRKGEWSSNGKYHYHRIKDETFYVTSGILILDYVIEDNGKEFKSIELKENDTFRIMPGVKHRFTSKTPEGCKFIEFSTKHSDDDSYRVQMTPEGWVYDNR
jgi:mannose-6-phosphate isomerase-like protein (cupin superfamily)